MVVLSSLSDRLEVIDVPFLVRRTFSTLLGGSNHDGVWFNGKFSIIVESVCVYSALIK